MITANIVVIVILLCSSVAVGAPTDEEPLSSTEDLVPYKDVSKVSQERLKNEVFCKISSFLNKKKAGLGPNCIAISPKVISYLKLYDYVSGYFWYESFIIEVFYTEGSIKISDAEDTKKVDIVPFC